MARSKAYLTIDAGGTYLKSAILNFDGKVFKDSAASVRSSSNGTKEEILWAFEEIISQGLEYVEGYGMDLRGIGIAIPGPFDIENATPLMKHKFQEIYGLNLREYFYDVTGILRNIPIKFIHDANAVLAGEIWKGNAHGFNNVAVVTLGTGLGFAYSENGAIQFNSLGGPKTTIYEFPYKEGILEDYTAQRGFLKIYHELSGKTNTKSLKVSDIGKLAEEGDELSIRTFYKIGQILAESLQTILKEKKIQCLLFGGQISRSFCYMEEPFKLLMNEVESLCKITSVKSIDNAALLGVMYNLIESLDHKILTIKE